MFFFTYRGVIVFLVGFVVAASLLMWPESGFAFWSHRSEPFIEAFVILLAVVLWTFRKGDQR
jgi:hypothetical protein